MELPVRINPHSSDDYYHAAEKVFEDWEKSMTPLKAQLKLVSDLQNEEKEIETTIGKISTEAHQAFVNLAVQDQLSAAVFEEEYQSYIKKQQKESEDIMRDFRTLARQISKVTLENATLSDKQQLLEKYKELDNRIKEKKAFIKSLQNDMAWETYVEQISDEFAAIQAHIAAESMFLSSILTQSMFGDESISTRTQLEEKISLVGKTQQDTLSPTTKIQ